MLIRIRLLVCSWRELSVLAAKSNEMTVVVIAPFIFLNLNACSADRVTRRRSRAFREIQTLVLADQTLVKKAASLVRLLSLRRSSFVMLRTTRRLCHIGLFGSWKIRAGREMVHAARVKIGTLPRGTRLLCHGHLRHHRRSRGRGRCTQQPN
jgi:hypothetical protein